MMIVDKDDIDLVDTLQRSGRIDAAETLLIHSMLVVQGFLRSQAHERPFLDWTVLDMVNIIEKSKTVRF